MSEPSGVETVLFFRHFRRFRGGYLAGADYVEGRWWKGGVKKAVDEFCAQNGCELDTVGRQFVITVR